MKLISGSKFQADFNMSTRNFIFADIMVQGAVVFQTEIIFMGSSRIYAYVIQPLPLLIYVQTPKQPGEGGT